MRKKLVGILCTVALAAGMTGCSIQNSAVATEEKKQTDSETKKESEIKENVKKRKIQMQKEQILLCGYF